jgi:hypothetical protein
VLIFRLTVVLLHWLPLVSSIYVTGTIKRVTGLSQIAEGEDLEDAGACSKAGRLGDAMRYAATTKAGELSNREISVLSQMVSPVMLHRVAA